MTVRYKLTHKLYPVKYLSMGGICAVGFFIGYRPKMTLTAVSNTPGKSLGDGTLLGKAAYCDKRGRIANSAQTSPPAWDLRCSGFWVPVSTMKGATRRRQPALGQSKERISLFRHNTAPISPESLLSGRSNPSGVAYPSNCFA